MTLAEVSTLVWTGLALIFLAEGFRDLVQAHRMFALYWQTSHAVRVGEQGVAVDILSAHVTIDPTTKAVLEKTRGAQAIADLFSLDNMQLVVSMREGGLPQPKFVNPYRFTRFFNATRMVPLLWTAVSFLLTVPAHYAHGGWRMWSVLVISALFALGAPLLAAITATIAEDTKDLWRQMVRAYLEHMGVEIEGQLS